MIAQYVARRSTVDRRNHSSNDGVSRQAEPAAALPVSFKDGSRWATVVDSY